MPDVWTKNNLPIQFWKSYRKKTTTKMIRMAGPFTVQTIHDGLVTCQDGYLAVDARGYPYPIDATEQELIYEEV